MNIAFITLGFTPIRTSGLDVSGERLVQALLDSGHQVTVIASGSGSINETRSHPLLTIIRLPMDRSNWIGFAFRAGQCLREIEKKQTFDVKHFLDVHFGYACRGDFLASLQHSFKQRIQTHGAKLPRLVYYYLAEHMAERPALKKAKGLLAGSAATRDAFVQLYSVSPEKIVLARHGIDTDVFHPETDTHSLRAILGIAENEPVIMFAGFVTPRKGLEFLAQALPHIQPVPRLVIVGRWGDAFRAQFYASLGPVRDQVIEAGFIPDDQMPTYFSMADVYVSPSLLEGFGLPLAEALACGTPVVAANTGSVSEVVGPGGILVAPRDSGALAEAISQLLQNPAQRRDLAMQGRDHIIQNFSLQSMLESTLAAYERFA